MHENIAFFDFDGTITRSDTMLKLAAYHKGTVGYYSGVLQIFPSLGAMKLGILSTSKGKEKFLTHFFGGLPEVSFAQLCSKFTKEVLPLQIRPDAMATIQKHQANNDKVVVVSASAENWVGPWCIENGLSYECSRLEINDGIITGKLKGNNCNGPEKATRILQRYDLTKYNRIYCYGDTKADNEMLQLATDPFYRYFKQ